MPVLTLEPIEPPISVASPLPATMHVSDLDGTVAVGSRGVERSVVIAVHDPASVPLTGVVVKVVWSGVTTSSATCTTGQDGQCTVSAVQKKATSLPSLTVKGLLKSGYKYTPGENHDVDGDSDGTQIML